MEDFVRRAIEAQGKADPDEVEREAEVVDLASPRKGDEDFRREPEPHWQDLVDWEAEA
jgi:hypothetical protein